MRVMSRFSHRQKEGGGKISFATGLEEEKKQRTSFCQRHPGREGIISGTSATHGRNTKQQKKSRKKDQDLLSRNIQVRDLESGVKDVSRS